MHKWDFIHSVDILECTARKVGLLWYKVPVCTVHVFTYIMFVLFVCIILTLCTL